MMNEVISGLWIGDLPSAMNVEKLKANNIFSILSAMRGRITVNETFIRHQILIDDTEDADILSHLLPSIHFIQAELDKGRGVLVHCQAGVSRSATIVAAYLMYRQNLDPEGALELIRKARPYIDPNPNFIQQLEVFHKAHYRISKKEKDIRRYYLGRTVEDVMSEFCLVILSAPKIDNQFIVFPSRLVSSTHIHPIASSSDGDGTSLDLDMLASYPRTPGSDSTPPTPTPIPRRRIRCKMCRHELAAREHMLDHGQLGPETPASMTPAASRRPSEVHHRSSFGQSTPIAGGTGPGQRRPSRSRLSFGSGILGDSLAMSTIGSPGSEKSIAEESRDGRESSDGSLTRNASGAERLKNFRSVSRGLMDSSLTMSSAVDDDDDDDEGEGGPPEHFHAEAARLLGRRLSDAVITPASESTKELLPSDASEIGAEASESPTAANGASSQEPMTTHLISSANLAAHLYANPKLAALRSSSSSIPTPPTSPGIAQPKQFVVSAPIIVNPKCSGYFVEPMKWMEPFLQDGHLSGKIICPNKKCGAKLGNYDWAGVCCGCKEWVVPGFCINRSKVDEIAV
ncbi:hypothetical protein D9756_006485 [Leucocoprinus leucothites]|uniref:protein-tyrosine-phosphatase n=1 Tax=Leucocoprinus leucothites TaxID=201217 RepID=A0A8H5G2C9_9AGAR|nr:hypothetical protein D9756_006485 [Leucoagaricus leucothites]